mmetsp:Transcript_3085/g.5957  ORF Transcript_3085/g.5957 Transcript_3085/m.5957 type:complete len:221 (-) Transcript_3085:42-704(-)
MKLVVVLVCLMFSCGRILGANIPFDELRQATATAIIGKHETGCDDVTSKLTSLKCFDDIVVLSNGDNDFFIPLMARDTPECFDFATYLGPFSSRSADGYAQASGYFFKPSTYVTAIGYKTYQFSRIVDVFMDTDDGLCATYYDIHAGSVGGAPPPQLDVSPEDVEEWKKVIADNIDMLEAKYGGNLSGEEAQAPALSLEMILVISVLIAGFVIALFIAFI